MLLPLHEVDKCESSRVALFADLHCLQHASVSQLLKYKLSTETARWLLSIWLDAAAAAQPTNVCTDAPALAINFSNRCGKTNNFTLNSLLYNCQILCMWRIYSELLQGRPGPFGNCGNRTSQAGCPNDSVRAWRTLWAIEQTRKQ